MSVKEFIETYCDDAQKFEFHYLNGLRQEDVASTDKGKNDALELLEYLGLEDNEISGIKTISYGEEDFMIIRLSNY